MEPVNQAVHQSPEGRTRLVAHTVRAPEGGELLVAVESAVVPTDASPATHGHLGTWFSARILGCGTHTDPFRAGDLVAVCRDGSSGPALATEMIVESSACLLAPPGLTSDAAALAGPAALAHVIADRSPLAPGSEVAVVGLGLIGVMLTAILAQEACWVRAVDPHWERRLVAAMLGAATSHPADAAEPANAAFETFGGTDTLWRAMALTRTGGSLVSVTAPLPGHRRQAVRRSLHLHTEVPGAGRRHLAAGLSLVSEREDWIAVAPRAVPLAAVTGDGVRARGPDELAVLVDPRTPTSRPSRYFRSSDTR